MLLKSSVRRGHGWEYGLQLIQCLSFFSCCMKYSDQSNWRENRLTLAQSPKVKSITVTKSQQRTLEESGPVARTVKEQGKKDANALLLLSMVYSSGSPLSKRYYSQGYHPNHSAKMILSRMTRDQVIPCLIKLMAEMNHHIQVPCSNTVVLSWRFLWS